MHRLSILFIALLFLPQDIRQAEPEKRDELLHRITQHGSVTGLAIAPDGILAAAGDTLRIWDGINGTPLVGLVGLYPGPFQAAAFSPDGTSIIGLSRDGELNAWAVGPLRFKASFIDRAKSTAAGKTKAHFGSQANALAYSPDGKLVVSAAADSPPIKVWNAETGELIRAIAPPDISEVTALAFSPDGDTLAFATARDVRFLKSEDWTFIDRTIAGHQGRIDSIAFSPDGEKLATASDDNTAHLWKAESGESIAELKGHTAAVRSVVFSPEGELAATASLDKTVRIWGLDGTLKSTIPHPRPVYAVAFTEAGSELLTAAADNTVRLWRVPDWKITQRLVAPEQDAVNAFLYEKAEASPDSPGNVPRMPVSALKNASPKAASSDLSAMATQILRLIQSNQAQVFDSLLSGDQFTIDGARLLAGGQTSLQDREGVLARLFDTNRLRVLIAKFGVSDLARFKSLRDILQSQAGSVFTEILDRPRGANQEDAALVVIHWKGDPLADGMTDYAQFSLARTSGGWRIVDVSLPLDTAAPSRFTASDMRVKQLRNFAQRLIQNVPDENVTLKKIVQGQQAALAFEIRFSKDNGQWWAPDLDAAEIEFRWDGDPADYNLKEYPRIRLRLEEGSWKIRP